MDGERKNVEKAKEVYADTVADFDKQIFDLQSLIASLSREQV